ncbi:MAG TPA: RNA polymerase sigma factor [Verrucomicrobiae bacterium]|jgi:RNA polymerase sigma-70 factor (ECF subfamily)|nr:RNA polymerase sigma factor [Verrucomicrobiae bacterium]
MNQTENFEQFMRNYQNMVFTTALRITANEAEAKDISQEVFLKAYERFEELHSSPTVGGWLRTVATNLSLNHVTRYRRRWTFFSEVFSDNSESDQPVFDIPAPELTGEYMNETDQRRVLEEALFKLPPAQRVPLVLYHFENKTYEEIAETLKISLSKVKTDIFRGREALKKKLMLGGAAEELRQDFAPARGTPASPPARNPFKAFARSLSPAL